MTNYDIANSKLLQINVRENRMGNQEWTIQRNWQHWTHETVMIIAQIIVDLTLNNNYATKSITHYSHDITEILLKVALSTITLTLIC
jgi:hypothetical protein